MTQKIQSVEEIVQELHELFDSSMWRDPKDETIALMGVGNVQNWLRTKLTAIHASYAEKENMIENLPRKFPELESDDYDRGYECAISDVLSILNEKSV